ncbi:hypothetical protein HAX54_015902 [Datura stramonium]|uniref:Uncharacterized protein n=1 Tax=Datura stramonium TaxID=4076 RepID=A0ABS8UIQ0_DATST|nr:hypothetical protein [Datura stramonium]
MGKLRDFFAKMGATGRRIFLSCSKLALEKPSAIRQTLLSYVADALDHAPSQSSSESEASQPSSSSAVLAEYFADIMDEYEDFHQLSSSFPKMAEDMVLLNEESGGTRVGFGPVAFCACAQSLTNLPQNLTSSGGLTFMLECLHLLPAWCLALLYNSEVLLQCNDDILLDIASKCDGYDAYDLLTHWIPSELKVKLAWYSEPTCPTNWNSHHRKPTLGVLTISTKWDSIPRACSRDPAVREILVDRSVHAATARFLSSDLSVGRQETCVG